MALMIISGDKVGAKEVSEVRSPFDNSVVDTVPKAEPAAIERAIAEAVIGAAEMRKTIGHQRYTWLHQAADLLRERKDRFATMISREEGKTIGESSAEVDRSIQTLELSAEEAKRITGQTVPLDGAPHGAGKLGFTLRIPCGVVVAISPFNFPLNLVVHKVGPALAAGNAVILKPASNTPLTAILFVELLLEAGVPPRAIHCLTGSGGKIGDVLCADHRVRKITFTGSFEVGEHICKTAGMKKVTMELGSNAPLIVMDDADIDKVVAATVATGYGNAGQVCISTQRILVDRKAYANFLDALVPKVAAIQTGDPLDPATKMGPMVRSSDAERVASWIKEAGKSGARVLTGGEQNGSFVQPAVVADVRKDMRISCEELFGPAVAVSSVGNMDEAIALAADTRFGLSAGIFTQNIDRAMRFIHEVDSGNLHVNWAPGWRADLMPYGGLKDSGTGKEGPSHAVLEMTEEKMVVIHHHGIS